MNPAALSDQARPSIPRILAVDDSELMHRLLRSRLQLEQVEIHTALNGEDGLRMAETLQPEVILLDIDLEGMDGFEVLQRLKENNCDYKQGYFCFGSPPESGKPIVFPCGYACTPRAHGIRQ